MWTLPQQQLAFPFRYFIHRPIWRLEYFFIHFFFFFNTSPSLSNSQASTHPLVSVVSTRRHCSALACQWTGMPVSVEIFWLTQIDSKVRITGLALNYSLSEMGWPSAKILPLFPRSEFQFAATFVWRQSHGDGSIWNRGIQQTYKKWQTS